MLFLMVFGIPRSDYVMGHGLDCFEFQEWTLRICVLNQSQLSEISRGAILRVLYVDGEQFDILPQLPGSL